MSQVVLVLDSPLDECEVRNRLTVFVKQFPVLQGQVSRDLKLAPYWKIPAKSGRDVTLTVRNADTPVSEASLLAHFENSVNAPFRDDMEHLAFHLFRDPERCLLAMAFDHRVFDARGAELFLNLFQQNLNTGSPAVSGDIAFTSTAALTQWSKKFLAGRNVNRRIIALSRSQHPRALPVPRERRQRVTGIISVLH